MSESTNACADVRELVPWYPTGTLAKSEMERVEAHVSECEHCSGLLDFSARLKQTMVEAEALHPAPEVLVSFVENPSTLSAGERESVTAHIPVCASCGEQVALLEQVERDDAMPVAAPVLEGSSSRSTFGRLWDALRQGILSPVPAAMYLLVAIAAVSFLFVQPGDDSPPAAGLGVDARGVVIVPDEGDRVRQGTREESREIVLDATATHLLLLELTGLQSPPRDDEEYAVSFTARDEQAPALSTTVTGAEFRENYTIGFTLGAGALDAGSYAVTVTSPAGAQVFHSTVTIRR